MSTVKATLREYEGLNSFPRPKHLTSVEFNGQFSTLDEEGEMQQFSVQIRYAPERVCLAADGVHGYLQLFRDRKVTCEALAGEIAADIREALKCRQVDVRLTRETWHGLTVTVEATAVSPPKHVE